MKTPPEIYDEVYQRMYRQEFVSEKEIAIQYMKECLEYLINQESYTFTPYEQFDSITCVEVADINKFIHTPPKPLVL